MPVHAAPEHPSGSNANKEPLFMMVGLPQQAGTGGLHGTQVSPVSA
jgi:hypothetical protein